MQQVLHGMGTLRWIAEVADREGSVEFVGGEVNRGVHGVSWKAAGKWESPPVGSSGDSECYERTCMNPRLVPSRGFINRESVRMDPP
ncbi:hypothetical protein GCM10009628_15490 [Paeniglutamicibacter kerguelensis]